MIFNYGHLPPWLERNILFRKLFLLRKLYLTKDSFKHHSQFAEDISIIRLFDKGYTGFFVDVGCFHPKKYNNTWLLYKKGWRGINIDIDAIKIEGFDLVRPGDTNIVSAVSDSTGEIDYYTNGFYSLTISLDEEFAEGREGYVKRTTNCDTLSHIIDSTDYKNKKIDFLSIDAEAHDLQVVKSLDFDRYAPKLIAVETHYPLFSQVEESELYKYLVDKGYMLVAWTGLTLLMASATHQKTMTEMFS